MGSKPKKRLILSILLCCVISASANAATIESLTLNAGHVKVGGASDAKRVSYKIYQDGETDINKICEMGEIDVVDGKFSADITMPKYMQGAETGGLYRIDIKGTSKDSKTFLFTGYLSRVTFLDDLNNPDADVFALFESNTDIMKNLGADKFYYNGIDANTFYYNNGLEETERKKIAANFLKEKGETTVDESNFSTIYNKAQFVQSVNKNGATELLIDKADLKFRNVKSQDVEFKAFDSERKKWVLSIMNDGTKYNKYSDAEAKYREANVLYELDNAKFTEYDTLLSSYDDAIGLNGETYYETYKGMDLLNKSNVNTALRNAIAVSKPKTKEAFKAAYKTAIEDEANAMKGKKDEPSYVNSSSSGGGGVPMIIPEVTNPTTIVSSFSDITSVGWAETAITALAKRGVISGYDDKTFKPQQSIKREEFVKMVIAAANIDLNKPACKFADVEQDKWYAQYVNAAFGAGIISGTSETDFGIGKGITREDMAVIIARLINLEDGEQAEVFADDAYISSYAKESIYKLYRAGKIAGVGDNNFAPKEIVTRAQAAKIIYDTLVSGN